MSYYFCCVNITGRCQNRRHVNNGTAKMSTFGQCCHIHAMTNRSIHKFTNYVASFEVARILMSRVCPLQPVPKLGSAHPASSYRFGPDAVSSVWHGSVNNRESLKLILVPIILPLLILKAWVIDSRISLWGTHEFLPYPPRRFYVNVKRAADSKKINE